MTEVADTMVQNTQFHNCTSLQERGAQDKCLGEVGNTTIIHPTETTNACKHLNGLFLEKVRMHSHFIIWFTLEVMIFFLNKHVGFVKCVDYLAWNRIFIFWARNLIYFDSMYAWLSLQVACQF